MPVADLPKARFGISGLDDVLAGGLTRDRLYLLEGNPGTGKTTAALQFLREGARNGERTLYVSMSETEQELRETAVSHGWTLDDAIDIYELIPPESLLDENQQQSLLYSSDLELGETTRPDLRCDRPGQAQPGHPRQPVGNPTARAGSSLRYRRQVLALKHYFARNAATVLMLDDLTSDTNDKTVHSIAHAVIRLEELAPEYGAERRRMRVIKYRGQRFRGGFHDFTITTGGVAVYPRLVSLEHKTGFVREPPRQRRSRTRRAAGRRRSRRGRAP